MQVKISENKFVKFVSMCKDFVNDLPNQDKANELIRYGMYELSDNNNVYEVALQSIIINHDVSINTLVSIYKMLGVEVVS